MGMAEEFVESRMGGDGYNTSSYSETQTYSSNEYGDGPPQVPYPWQARWSDRDRSYCFVHQETGEEVWDYDEVIRRTRGGGMSETQVYEQQDSYSKND